MILVIDAFNAIYKFPELEENMYRGELEKARKGLLRILIKIQNKWKRPLEVHLFFDGKKRRGVEIIKENSSGIAIYYSQDLSADYLIKEYIKRSANPGQLRIISSDKDIREFARKHRCQRQTSEEFATWAEEILSQNREKKEKSQDPVLTESEIEYWQRIFKKSIK